VSFVWQLAVHSWVKPQCLYFGNCRPLKWERWRVPQTARRSILAPKFTFSLINCFPFARGQRFFRCLFGYILAVLRTTVYGDISLPLVLSLNLIFSLSRKRKLKIFTYSLINPRYTTGPASYGVGAILLNFLKLKVQFTANWGPAQRNGFHFRILMFLLSLILLITHTIGEVNCEFSKYLRGRP